MSVRNQQGYSSLHRGIPIKLECDLLTLKIGM